MTASNPYEPEIDWSKFNHEQKIYLLEVLDEYQKKTVYDFLSFLFLNSSSVAQEKLAESLAVRCCLLMVRLNIVPSTAPKYFRQCEKVDYEEIARFLNVDENRVKLENNRLNRACK